MRRNAYYAASDRGEGCFFTPSLAKEERQKRILLTFTVASALAAARPLETRLRRPRSALKVMYLGPRR
jgi:hypothetical protein